MRKLFFVLCVSLTLPFSHFSRAEKAESLTNNAGFEDWDMASQKDGLWVAQGYNLKLDKGGTAFRSGDGEVYQEKHSGKFAQYIMTKGMGQGIISKGFPVKVGAKYNISIWVNILSGKFQMGTCFAHKPWTYIGPWVYGEANSKWTRYVKKITIPEGCKTLCVVIFVQNGSGYFDDLEVREMTADAEKSEASGIDRMALLEGKAGKEITRKRVALFCEPGFPSESPRSVEWYENTLKKAGLSVTKLSNDELCDPVKFKRGNFDTLIIPTGGFFPDKAEEQVEKFLAGGGTVLTDESMTTRTSPLPMDIEKELDLKTKKYEKGEDIYEYMEYLSRIPCSPEANVFEYDKDKKKWIPSLELFDSYENPNHKNYFNCFLLSSWPNHKGGASTYARLFNTPLTVNSELKKILPELPDAIPADDKASPIKGALRLQGVATSKTSEFVCDLLLPVYLFKDVSNRKYLAFEEAGKSPKDMEADFYICRYHNLSIDGGTFIHLGNAGAKLMRTDVAEKLLLNLLKLAEAELPGEVPVEYVNTVKEIKKAFSVYSGKSVEFRDLLAKASRLASYEGKGEILDAYIATHKKEKEAFEKLSVKYDNAEDLILKRDSAFVYGNETMKKLTGELNNETDRLEKELAALSDKQKLSPSLRMSGVKYPYLKEIYWGLDNIGGRGPVKMKELRDMLEKDGFKFAGFKVNSYRFAYPGKNSAFKKDLKSGNFKPETGKVQDTKYRWFTDKTDRENWRESFRWKLERVAKTPEVTAIYGMEERDLKCSLWGEWPRTLFLKYLEGKHGTLDKLNACYNAQYENFEQIKLPVGKPETQTEHALWEDWTRFREVYVRDEEFKPVLELLERYAPNKLFLSFGTYNQHGKNPANGINFYEYGKALKVNGFEHSNREDKEFLTFDIVSMHSKNLTAEWGALYFPPGTHQERVDLLDETLWKGIANGQIGWSLFTFSSPAWRSPSANFYDLTNLPLPTGSKLRLINGEFKKLAHIVLDGKREEAPVRIVYSPTTRRHTSWPSVKDDISYLQNQGLYRVFKEGHLQARAIDEQAVQEGLLSDDCKLLIIPSVIYENRTFHDKALKFLEAGGNVFVTVDSGKFNEYGKLRNSWLGLAGVVPVEAKDKVVLLENGVKYFSMANAKETFGLKSLFGNESVPVVKFRDGTPAITETAVGKGKLFVSGIPLGKDCADHWIGKPEVVFSLLKPIFERAGIERNILASDIQIMARPWEHEGKKYLFLTDRGRDGIKKFTLSLLGAWNVKDYLMDAALKTEYDGSRTFIEGVIHSPGGLLYELEKSLSHPVNRKASAPVKVIAYEHVKDADKPLQFDETHPFEGRIWSGNTATVLGEFSFDFDVETGGGWHGKTYLVVSHKNETLKKLCEKGRTLEFHFSDCVLKVECLEVTDVYPVNIKCRVSVGKLQPAESKCMLEREIFNGQESYVLSNGIIKVRVLPGIGGRIINFISLPDETDHCYCDTDVIMKYSGKSWSDIGGIEENGGGFPGPYWNAQFKVETVQDTPEKIILLLLMEKAVDWKLRYANPKSGRSRLSKEITLNKNESILQIKNRAFNEALSEMPTGLRVHPAWNVGGDISAGDKLIAETANGLLCASYPFKQVFHPLKNWTAILDSEKKVAIFYEFDHEQTDEVYTCSSEKNYTVELWSKILNLKPGDALNFDYSINYIKGLTGILGYSNGVAVDIRMKKENNSGSFFEMTIGSCRDLSASFSIVAKAEGKTLKEFPATILELKAGRSEEFSFVGDAENMRGTDEIVLTVSNKNGSPLLTISQRLFSENSFPGKSVEEAISEYDKIINSLNSRYKDMKLESIAEKRMLKMQITNLVLLLEELKKGSLPPDNFQQSIMNILRDAGNY